MIEAMIFGAIGGIIGSFIVIALREPMKLQPPRLIIPVDPGLKPGNILRKKDKEVVDKELSRSPVFRIY